MTVLAPPIGPTLKSLAIGQASYNTMYELYPVFIPQGQATLSSSINQIEVVQWIIYSGL